MQLGLSLALTGVRSIPRETGSSYAFTGASGTKLSAIPDWDLASPSANGDSIEINATNRLKKVASTGPVLYLETGGGARTQQITGDILANNNHFIGVLCTWNGGIDGYFLRRSSSTTARLMRYDGGVVTNLRGTIACSTGILGLRAVVSADDSEVVLTVTENGSQIDTYTDTSSDRSTRGRVAIASIATGSTDPIMDTVTTYATGYFGGTGVVQSVDLGLIGRATPANNGAMDPALDSLGLLVSGQVGVWEFTKVSGGTKWPDVVSNGSTPAPTSALDNTDADDVVVYDVKIDGEASGETLTITVQGASGTAAQSIATTADIARLSLGGADPLVWFMKGSRDSWSAPSAYSNGSPATFSSKTAHTGTLKITAHANTVRVPALAIVDCARVDVCGLTLDGYIPETYAVVGDPYEGEPGEGNRVYGPSFTQAWPERQNKEIVRVHGEGTVTVRVYDCIIGAPSGTAKTNWLVGVLVEGGSTTLTYVNDVVVGVAPATVETWTVNFTNLDAGTTPLGEGNLIQRVNQGINANNVTNLTCRGNIVRDILSNGHFIGGKACRDAIVADTLVLDRWVNPADPGTHGDAVQFGIEVASDYERCGVERVICLSVYGDGVMQGPFFGDIGTYAGTYTGYYCVDCYVRNVAFAAGSTNGLVMDIGTGWVVDGVSMLSPPSGQTNNGNPKCRGIDANVGGVPESAVGTAAGVGAYALEGSGITYAASCFDIDTAGESACYDNPSHSDPITRFKPKTGGSYDLGAGSWGGAFKSDMTWA